LTRSEALRLICQGEEKGCSEALFAFGESPWSCPGFEKLLPGTGRSEFMEYLVELCELALEHGLLPHTNAGILAQEDLVLLQPYNASMGLMLESTARLAVHAASPGKEPKLRMEHIARAGKLHIPFTTGILVGIGESWKDRMESLRAIADLHRTFGHIQEVIIQPLDPKSGTALHAAPRPEAQELCTVVDLACRILPAEVAVQIPPNLVDPLPLVRAGATDLGGISPVTADWINPEKSWPAVEELQRDLAGYALRERLPVYPAFIRRGWHGCKTRELVAALAGEDGLRAKKYIF
jgi:FO synthase subunit 1